MPNNQIEKGYDFSNGQLVTADNLDSLAQEATLKKGAISEQPLLTETVATNDEVIIHDVSDSVQVKPKKATIEQVLNSGANATINQLTTNAIVSSGSISVSTQDGPTVVSTGYSHVSGNVVTVASASHGLQAGDYVETFCTESAGDLGIKFSGKFEVFSVSLDGNAFTYKVNGTVSASSGLCTWKKSGVVKNNNSLKCSDDLVSGGNLMVSGNAKILGDKSVLMPKGNSASRPINPESGELRFNTETEKLEIYDGVSWINAGPSGTPETVTEHSGVGGNTTVASTHANIDSTGVLLINQTYNVPLKEVWDVTVDLRYVYVTTYGGSAETGIISYTLNGVCVHKINTYNGNFMRTYQSGGTTTYESWGSPTIKRRFILSSGTHTIQVRIGSNAVGSQYWTGIVSENYIATGIGTPNMVDRRMHTIVKKYYSS